MLLLRMVVPAEYGRMSAYLANQEAAQQVLFQALAELETSGTCDPWFESFVVQHARVTTAGFLN